MIKFFRRIRQKLLSESRFSKYFIYAIGEIILVVIGILIALQINNWNENRKLTIKTQNYYSQLIDDLNKDKIFINSTIAKFTKQRNLYQNYLSSFEERKMTKSEMYNTLRSLNMESYAIDFNTSTIESLQNSGEIVLIPPELRNKLLDLKRQQEKISRDESLDNRGKTGIAERTSMLTGAMSLEERLRDQDELMVSLDFKKNKNNIILGLEAIQDWMDFSEKKSIRLLNEVLNEIESVEKLIKENMD